MVIQDIQTGRISLPLRHPFKTALRTVDAVEDVVVRVIADTGETGYGEAPPTAVITGDTLGSIECAVRDFIRPALLGMEIENLDGIMKKLHGCILKNTSAKAAVDMAVYDLYGKRLGAPVYQLLGGARKRVETDLTISVNPIEEMVADALEAVDATGFDWILSNPPYHADFSVPKRFIEKGFNRLKVGGCLVMVVKRLPWYRNKLTAVFGGVRVREVDGYYVLTAQRRALHYAEKKVKPRKG